MKITPVLILGCGLVFWGGCGKPLLVEPAMEASLGQVEYADAFATAREVMSRHFQIQSADPATGIIQAQPQPFEAPADRFLGGNTPARQTAKITVYKKNEQVYVLVSVLTQRQASLSYQQPQPGDNYGGVPNQTPAQIEAATTSEQNESWQTQNHDHGTEMRIISEITQALRTE